eukprot:TRINITY_DN18232_c1_g2_i1.p1 TRINITY_DN18232_c1_g2~~TRINITY_DN18232_c1_g2_i1.p1  ORF type:complete len:592 (+),score=92.34 TRINITY_DN18232_c1_g2_i1:70-1845(+)
MVTQAAAVNLGAGTDASTRLRAASRAVIWSRKFKSAGTSISPESSGNDDDIDNLGVLAPGETALSMLSALSWSGDVGFGDVIPCGLGRGALSAAEFAVSTTSWGGDVAVPLSLQRRIVLNLPLKRRVNALFEPQGLSEEIYAQVHSVASTLIFVVTIAAILLSIASFCIETLPAYYEAEDIEFVVIESNCIGWFTLELCSRFITCRSKTEFLGVGLNWVDIVSIVPFYVDLVLAVLGQGGGGATSRLLVLRVVRLTRVFRVFKLSKYNDNVQLVVTTLKNSVDALRMQVFLMTIATVLFGSIFFITEQESSVFNETDRKWTRKPEYDAPGIPDPIESIPQGFWWAITTLTGVGYGDTYPVTVPGYCLGAATMLTGLLVTSFPVIILGANFVDARAALARRRALARIFSQRRRLLLLNFSTDPDNFELKGSQLCDTLDQVCTEPPEEDLLAAELELFDPEYAADPLVMEAARQARAASQNHSPGPSRTQSSTEPQPSTPVEIPSVSVCSGDDPMVLPGELPREASPTPPQPSVREVKERQGAVDEQNKQAARQLLRSLQVVNKHLDRLAAPSAVDALRERVRQSVRASLGEQ